MRIWILLVVLILGGCAKQQEPTYLKCVTSYAPEYKLYVVLDHENELWISTTSEGSLDLTLRKYGLDGISTQRLFTDVRRYYIGGEDQEKFYLDRASLIYEGILSYQCEVTDANPLLRSLGIEKGRIKI
tara:strand:- start:16 stop:402 length:387 start_codon:yes stop_codon:yes gene_type:complete